jgi:hypothetical protein
MLASHMPREVVLQYLAITTGKSVDIKITRRKDLPSGKPTGYLATVPLMILQIFGTVEPFTAVDEVEPTQPPEGSGQIDRTHTSLHNVQPGN